MVNKVCRICVNLCKQDETAQIVNCPQFRKKASEKEFRDMLDDLDRSEAEAKTVQKRVKSIIRAAIDSAAGAVSEDSCPPAQENDPAIGDHT